MGAGQIGGIATLLDMDFQNPAGFVGDFAANNEAQHVVYYLSHSMLFCLGAIIEAHVIITPAECVFGERYKFGVFAGTHKFMEHAGVERQISHVCINKGYNHTNSWHDCKVDRHIALMMMNTAFSFSEREDGADFIINRLRYGATADWSTPQKCAYYGYGSRRNGYLIPLLIHLRRHEVTMYPPSECVAMYNYVDTYLCIHTPQCLSEKFGALCPDDLGSVLVCDAFARGMMISRLVDRPCGMGFVNLDLYRKFIMCGVDDSREVLSHEDFTLMDFATSPTLITPTAPVISTTLNDTAAASST